MIYAGTVWLRRTEEEVWKLTPRKLQALLKVHYEMVQGRNGQSVQQSDGFIDNIPGW